MNYLFTFVFAFLLLPSLLYAQVPTCSTAIAATPMGPFPCSATIAWQDNSGNETQFLVERQLNGGSWSQLPAVKANVTSTVDATLTQDPAVDNNYCYRVAAGNLDAAGKPQQSAWTTASAISCKLIPKKALVAIPAPAAPSGLTTAAVGQTVIRLSWSDNSDSEMGFDIERWTNKPQTASLFGVPIDSVTWDDTGLTKARTYCYRVRAKNNGGDSSYTAPSCATTNR